MYSFVSKIAIDVNRAVQDDMIIPALGLNNAKVLEFNVEADPSKISVIIKKTSFFSNSNTFFAIIVINFKSFKNILLIVFLFYISSSFFIFVVIFNEIGSSFFEFGYAI